MKKLYEEMETEREAETVVPESPQNEPEPQAPKPGLDDLIRSAQRNR